MVRNFRVCHTNDTRHINAPYGMNWNRIDTVLVGYVCDNICETSCWNSWLILTWSIRRRLGLVFRRSLSHNSNLAWNLETSPYRTARSRDIALFSKRVRLEDSWLHTIRFFLISISFCLLIQYSIAFIWPMSVFCTIDLTSRRNCSDNHHSCFASVYLNCFS